MKDAENNGCGYLQLANYWGNGGGVTLQRLDKTQGQDYGGKSNSEESTS